MPLRLALFGRTMPAHRSGKGMFHPYLVAQALAARGHQCHIITTAHPAGIERDDPARGLEIHYLPAVPADRYSPEFFAASAARFDRLHQAVPFDAAWSDSAGAAGFVQHSRSRDTVPLIAVCHAGLTMMTKPAAREFFATTEHGILSRAAAIIAVSGAVRGSIAAGLPSVAPRIRIIRNGADPALFAAGASESLRAGLNLDSRPILLYIGRVVPEKGLADLLHAATAIAPPPQILIVGPGSFATQLRALSRDLRIPLTLVPGVPHDQTPHYLALADLFILPTHHQEGLPFSLIEAMLARRPVIASDIGGVSELIRHEETGLLVPPRDPSALAAAISRLLSDPPFRARLTEAAHDLALREYSLDSMISAIEALLAEVIDPASSRTHLLTSPPAHLLP